MPPEMWVLLIYVSGLIITWLGFSYKKGCAKRRYIAKWHDSIFWYSDADDWNQARFFCSFLWPVALIAFVIWFVGWVCLLQWLAKLIMMGTKKLEQLGQNKGCPKIVLDKR